MSHPPFAIYRTMRWILSITLLIALTALASTDNPVKINRPNTNDRDTTASIFFINDELRQALMARRPAQLELGLSKKGRKIEAWYFPGTSNKNALVIGGVHGSELSAIEVAHALIRQLAAGDSIYYNVIVIPSLFPDNAAIARQQMKDIGSPKNVGRYSFIGAPDPNRQMPTPGTTITDEEHTDHAGRKVEWENMLLLRLINELKPQRIASLHAIRNKEYAGFFADPRTDEEGLALGYETDSSLAVMMASYVGNKGGSVPGNRLSQAPTALYYKDPAPVAKGFFQERNFRGSPMPGYKGSGVSLGTWGATAVKDTNDVSRNRDAIRIITIEFPGSKRPQDYSIPSQRTYCSNLVNWYAAAIADVFLQANFIE
jgi:hypothetical protein